MMIECSTGAIALTLLWVFFVHQHDIPPPEPESATAHLVDRKRAIHENLRDLHFDFRTGKLSDTDYQSGKLSLQVELQSVLLQIRDASPAETACSSCGGEFSRRMKFCGNCGKAII